MRQPVEYTVESTLVSMHIGRNVTSAMYKIDQEVVMVDSAVVKYKN